MLDPMAEPVLPSKVLAEACQRFELTLEDIRAGKSRRRVVARRWVILTLRAAGHSVTDIGEAMGCDHTTVSHHLRVMERMTAEATPPLGDSP